jgi:hypothetical protein
LRIKAQFTGSGTKKVPWKKPPSLIGHSQPDIPGLCGL